MIGCHAAWLDLVDALIRSNVCESKNQNCCRCSRVCVGCGFGSLVGNRHRREGRQQPGRRSDAGFVRFGKFGSRPFVNAAEYVLTL